MPSAGVKKNHTYEYHTIIHFYITQKLPCIDRSILDTDSKQVYCFECGGGCIGYCVPIKKAPKADRVPNSH